MNALPMLLSAIVAFLATISAGIFIRKLQNNVGVICAFSSGFFVALAFFELLPDVLSLAPQTEIPMERLILMALSGFSLLFAIDLGFSKFHVKDRHITKKTYHQKAGLIATIEFCSHAFLEGIAIGLSFQLQFGLGIFVAIAVISHDFCDGISTLALMLNSGNTLKSSLNMLFVDAIAPFLGVLATLLFAVQSTVLVYALSFLFGSFVYIGAVTLLPDAYRMNRPSVTIAFFMVGFGLVVLLSQAIT